jgi:hypothetical protein
MIGNYYPKSVRGECRAFGEVYRTISLIKALLLQSSHIITYLCLKKGDGMCFSATASFSAAGLLGITGIVAVVLAPRSLRLFAATPLFFAVQQAFEGFIWLHAAVHDQWYKFAVYGFLFFATIFWPIWMPYVCGSRERIRSRKIILLMCGVAGALSSINAVYFLAVHGAHAFITNNHIAYLYPAAQSFLPDWVGALLYCGAVIVPCFAASIARLWIMGLGIIAGLIVAQLYYPAHFASVWCFFAAIVSSAILYIVWYNRRKER